MTIAATLPVDSVWTRKTTSLCHLLSSHPSVISSCQLVVALPLVALSLCRPLLVLSSCQAPACCSITSRRPLIAPPSRLLVAPAGCHIVSWCPIVAPLSHQLVAPACCRVTSPCPLVAPRAALFSSCCASWLLRHLLTHRPLVILSYLRAASRCLVMPAGCLTIISRCPLVAPPSHPLIVLAGCCVASSPCAALLFSTPSNAIEHH
jgi:hypothetical protein